MGTPQDDRALVAPTPVLVPRLLIAHVLDPRNPERWRMWYRATEPAHDLVDENRSAPGIGTILRLAGLVVEVRGGQQGLKDVDFDALTALGQ